MRPRSYFEDINMPSMRVKREQAYNLHRKRILFGEGSCGDSLSKDRRDRAIKAFLRKSSWLRRILLKWAAKLK